MKRIKVRIFWQLLTSAKLELSRLRDLATAFDYSYR